MPAVVMENELYTYETQEDRSPVVAKPSSLSLSRVTSAPEPVRSDNPQSIEARYLASKSPPTPRNPRSSSESATLATSWSAAAYSHLETLAERPEKRPRLDQTLDTGFADSFRRGSSLKVRTCSLQVAYAVNLTDWRSHSTSLTLSVPHEHIG